MVMRNAVTVNDAAEFLRQYYTANSPFLTGALRRSWRVNEGINVAVCFSQLPWAYRVRRNYNRLRRDVLNNGLRNMRRRFPHISASVAQQYGSITITCRYRS